MSELINVKLTREQIESLKQLVRDNGGDDKIIQNLSNNDNAIKRLHNMSKYEISEIIKKNATKVGYRIVDGWDDTQIALKVYEIDGGFENGHSESYDIVGWTYGEYELDTKYKVNSDDIIDINDLSPSDVARLENGSLSVLYEDSDLTPYVNQIISSKVKYKISVWVDSISKHMYLNSDGFPINEIPILFDSKEQAQNVLNKFLTNEKHLLFDEFCNIRLIEVEVE